MLPRKGCNVRVYPPENPRSPRRTPGGPGEPQETPQESPRRPPRSPSGPRSNDICCRAKAVMSGFRVLMFLHVCISLSRESEIPWLMWGRHCHHISIQGSLSLAPHKIQCRGGGMKGWWWEFRV